MSLALAHNPRTVAKAAIKRASKQARASMNRLDRTALDELTQIYQRAAESLQADIQGYAGIDGGVRLEVLQDMLRQTNARLDQLATAWNTSLDNTMINAATLGVQPFAVDAALITTSLSSISNNAVQFVRSFVANDGLQLSDRIWRINNHAREAVTRSIQSAVIQGHSASQAARDFLSRGESVPADIINKMGMANADRIARQIKRDLMTGVGSPHDNAMRLFRTEINRAHGEAYMAAGFELPDAIGSRFLLSPRHPDPDICDMHASVNRYGLGPGVYPKGRTPWPAHPNTLSYVEVVFDDEVSNADRNSKETRIEWLQSQPPASQEAVLGGRKKRAAFQRGILRENEIATPWNVLRKRYERRGVDVANLRVTPLPDLPGGTGITGPRNPAQVRTDALRYVLEQGERTGFEHALVYDVRNGTQFVKKTVRSKNSVSFTTHELALFANPKNRLDLVHNHPSGSSLSLPDLRMGTLPGIERVTAYGHDGSLYTARTLIDAGTLARLNRAISPEIENHLLTILNSGKLSSSQANHIRQHVKNLVLDAVGAIEYSVERIDGALKGVLAVLDDDTLQTMIDAAVKQAGNV